MERNLFPRTTVAGVSLSRMIIGTNWILGWSHRSPAADQQIKNRFPGGNEVFPLLKAFLDEYEIFMDKYIEFMKSYNNSTDVASMMTQYTEIVGEYYKYMEALDKYDTDTMSAADAAYYLEVVARVEKKLLQATGY